MGGDVYRRFCAAAVQAAPAFLDRDASISKLEHWAAKAKAAGADMLYAPIDQHAFYRRLYDNAIEVPSPQVEQLADIARRHRVLLSVGDTEKGSESMGTMWNTPQDSCISSSRDIDDPRSARRAARGPSRRGRGHGRRRDRPLALDRTEADPRHRRFLQPVRCFSVDRGPAVEPAHYADS
jgi:carbon-nitrogen hydrolase